MKILVEEGVTMPTRGQSEDLRKVIMAFDALKPGESLLLPKEDILKRYSSTKNASLTIRGTITKSKRDKDAKVVTRPCDDGVRIWKKLPYDG